MKILLSTLDRLSKALLRYHGTPVLYRDIQSTIIVTPTRIYLILLVMRLFTIVPRDGCWVSREGDAAGCTQCCQSATNFFLLL